MVSGTGRITWIDTFLQAQLHLEDESIDRLGGCHVLLHQHSVHQPQLPTTGNKVASDCIAQMAMHFGI